MIALRSLLVVPLFGAALLSTACHGPRHQGASHDAPASAPASVPASAPASVPASPPTSKLAQRALLDDAVWHAEVDRAHEGLAAFVTAEQLREQGNEEWRTEMQRGSQLLRDALDATWEIEYELEKDPARARTHESILLTRARWNRKLREAGKILRD